MRGVRLSDLHCSVARTLDVVGERWTLLVLRDAFMGKHRFEEFASSLPIARNVLTDRLQTLVDHGVLRRIDLKSVYKVTPGEALCELFGLDSSHITYGRTALIYCNNEPAIELLEIVTPVEEK